ncbi:MAG: mechanosensitive ion channel [Leptolyngbya sp. SIO1D8]|nr:mechanosensitive ion channel [Leptolyngbya sp. SIO1D8]
MVSLSYSPVNDAVPLPLGAPPVLAQIDIAPMENFLGEMSRTLGSFLPSLIWAIIILIVGWIVATIAAVIVKGILKQTTLDNRLTNMLLGQDPNQDVAVEQWIATAVYWVIMIFTLVAFLNALNLEVVSQPLNDFLQQIFQYLPRIGGAAVLLGVAWATATVVKVLMTQGLARFNLDDRLADQVGGSRSPFVLNETIGNILYWFIFLLFVPLILSALDLPGLLTPVESLIDQFLQAIPRIVTAGIIFLVGWFVARIVRDIVTNLLKATQADQIGSQFGLSASDTEDGVALSSLAGTIVYVLILIPTAVAALNELDIEAISDPAVSMLEQVLSAVPQVLMAGVVLVAFYVIGRFVGDLVTSVLRSVGFDNILNILGLPELTAPEAEPTINAEGQPEVRIESTAKTPSEFAGLIVLVGIVLFGAITATEILQFEVLTNIVQSILRVSVRVLSGLALFAVGLYFANLAFRLIRNMSSRQANFLAQAARVAIITLVGIISLQQMGLPVSILNVVVWMLFAGIAIAIGLAFGLGGRDIAAEQIREWLNAFKQES